MTQRFAAPLIVATRALSYFLFNSITRLFNLKIKQTKKREEKKSQTFKLQVSIGVLERVVSDNSQRVKITVFTRC
jgi:hypothetical protein